MEEGGRGRAWATSGTSQSQEVKRKSEDSSQKEEEKERGGAVMEALSPTHTHTHTHPKKLFIYPKIRSTRMRLGIRESSHLRGALCKWRHIHGLFPPHLAIVLVLRLPPSG